MVKRRVPNVVRGGTAIPLRNKPNYYYMAGRTHEDGGIDIGRNPRTGLEVEDGEVMHIGDKDIKVFSAQPFLNGKSPAQRVIQGDNPNDVFNAQESYKRRNKINDDGTKKKRMGGLSRKKDYGSKSKPYPKVKSKDFAGGHRSYPIPTKADARDALRLAGLHGRSDVKAKVYAKYPELRKKSAFGGVYSLTTDKGSKLMNVPSTGEFQKAMTAKTTKMKYGGRRKAPYGISSIYRPFNADDTINPLYSSEATIRKRNKELADAVKIDLENELARRGRVDYSDPSISPLYSDIRPVAKTTNTASNTNVSTTAPRDNSLIENAIGLGSNIISGIIGTSITNSALNNMRYSSTPMMQRAAKLKTRININPQLDKMRESLASYEREIDANTGSSQVALARKQRARLNTIMNTNHLYGEKENIETNLINRDRLNQQTVANTNVKVYNDWSERKAAFDNAIRGQKLENRINLINTINAGIQDNINNIQLRRTEGRTINAMSLANPNLPAEMFLASGIWNQEMYDTYRNAYPLRGKRRRTGSN